MRDGGEGGGGQLQSSCKGRANRKANALANVWGKGKKRQTEQLKLERREKRGTEEKILQRKKIRGSRIPMPRGRKGKRHLSCRKKKE